MRSKVEKCIPNSNQKVINARRFFLFSFIYVPNGSLFSMRQYIIYYDLLFGRLEENKIMGRSSLIGSQVIKWREKKMNLWLVLSCKLWIMCVECLRLLSVAYCLRLRFVDWIFNENPESPLLMTNGRRNVPCHTEIFHYLRCDSNSKNAFKTFSILWVIMSEKLKVTQNDEPRHKNM